MRILVADDDASLRFLCRVALESVGHEVLLAEDGKEVIERLRVDAPELVLLDLTMPYMDGMQVLRHLRPDQRETVPILLLSARSSVADRARGLEAGAVDYITKPFQPKEMLAMAAAETQMLSEALATSFVKTLQLERVVVLEIQRGGVVHACASAASRNKRQVPHGYVRPGDAQEFIDSNKDVHIVKSGGVFSNDMELQRTEVWFAIPGTNAPFGMVAIDCAPGDVSYANDMAYVRTMIAILSMAMRSHRAEDRLISLARADELGAIS